VISAFPELKMHSRAIFILILIMKYPALTGMNGCEGEA
jgi:hypothetical protein